jgi:hypothetical protein
MKRTTQYILLLIIPIVSLASHEIIEDSTSIALIDSATKYTQVNNNLAIQFGLKATQIAASDFTKANALKQLG